jgi:hypothetical protein
MEAEVSQFFIKLLNIFWSLKEYILPILLLQDERFAQIY